MTSSGTVSGVAGGGNYTLQSKTATPTKSQQAITADSGYYGLSGVTVAAIPEVYQDVSSVTAAAADVLATKVFVDAEGTVTAGTMANNGAVSKTLDATASNQTYTVPAGYHSGSGQVKIVLETKSATPTTSSQDVTPTTGKVLSKVTVAAIPSQYKDTTNVDATAGDVLSGKTIVTSSGEVEGSMANNGAVSATIDVRSGHTSYTVPAGYHNGEGTVSLVTEEKSATPTTSAQNITPTAGKVLSKVTVAAIPSNYKDTTNVDAAAGDVLAGKTIVTSTGEVTGTMVNRGAVSKVLDATTSNQSYTVPAGYHNGEGTVSIVLEQKSATPSGSSQTITPTSGKVLSQVTVNAIPAKYGDTTGDTATAAYVLAGYKAHTISSGSAVQITGEMANNGAISGSIDGLTTTSYTISAGYTSGGTVSLDDSIENALAAI